MCSYEAVMFGPIHHCSRCLLFSETKITTYFWSRCSCQPRYFSCCQTGYSQCHPLFMEDCSITCNGAIHWQQTDHSHEQTTLRINNDLKLDMGIKRSSVSMERLEAKWNRCEVGCSMMVRYPVYTHQ